MKCKKCGKEKTRNEFYAARGFKICKSCYIKNVTSRRNSTPAKRRKYLAYAKKYNIEYAKGMDWSIYRGADRKGKKNETF